MKVCKRDGCTNEVSAKATWCSDACRMAATRTKKDEQPEQCSTSSEPEQPEQLEIVASEEHYLANPDMYAKRNNPYGMNWGKPMGVKTLHRHGFRLNRVTIPGDWDYVSMPKPALKHAKVPY